MNENNDIQFPADFDDLSKYAPLLHKLRGKGDGFVVPENYFDEQKELTDAKTIIPSSDGFIVPENYFEDLAERIVELVYFSIGNRKSEIGNPFKVPENYFEDLTERIATFIQLSDTIESRQSDIRPGGDNSFSIPENYFKDLDATLETKLALDNLKQDEGFIIPENYFEKLTDKVLSRAAVEELNTGSDADIPAGYFDTLADRISARIADEENGVKENAVERGRIIVFAEVLKRYSRPVSIAAAIALIVGVSIWFFNHNQEKPGKSNFTTTNPPKQNVQPVIPVAPKDSVIPVQPQNIAVQQPKNKKHKTINQTEQPVVKAVEKNDVLEHLDLLDVNMVADFVSDREPAMKNNDQEEFLNEQMMKYILDDNADPSEFINNK